ncbi:glycoprotein-N-acetylgalactosamine 3-beta-galactosyltransferase 1 [Drosophila mojavensis]|uniref:Glycoprotein-N-acetylgalactosamine 3-beta-galactosyltransferase 1 n=1 Tax=Drosophila mojavensis TaxID=7230 RepID=B4KEA6_DROMO|nr:glycoprotein-N-acetylgalactosamine 3-beta-galactosyltransferase 1 [Drosophila mojavensis]EDW11851.2 uncharacterized protein Dmoj_GI12912 [Drosophila mojavensis]
MSNNSIYEARLLWALIVGTIAGYILTEILSYRAARPMEQPSLAEQLKKEVRVLCWVMTHPGNHKLRALHVKRTWGKRCNILLFMSSQLDDELPTVKLNLTEGRNYLWMKTKSAFKYVYNNYYNDSDWFFKADDDTFAVIENMRYMLYRYNSETPVYFGCKFKKYFKQGFMSGGAGYILSREALRRFVVEGLSNPKICKSGPDGAEDLMIGLCMQNLNVTAGDSRDANGHGRMYPLYPAFHLHPPDNKTFWYWNYAFYNTTDCFSCVANTAISFHYVKPNEMYQYDYFIYTLKAYGLIHNQELKLPTKLAAGEYNPEGI